ncbi:hypothetical protein S83_012802, partial [Arachis hypogaea]
IALFKQIGIGKYASHPNAIENVPYDYTRSGNSTRDALESLLAKLDKADRALCFTSRMVPLSAVSHLVQAVYPYPANSPHLRKSGNRAVVSDLDEHEVENGAEEGFLYSGEVNDSKGGMAPISASGIMPSPIFLWRFKNLIEMDFQVFLFFVWAFICCKIGWDSVMRISADKWDIFLYEAFLYFNLLLLTALMVWL